MDHVKKAKELFNEGCNCAQAVFCAYSDDYGIDPDTALRITGAMGGGIGGTRGVCGAVSGMALVCGLKNASTDLSDKETKDQTYKLTKEKMEAFRDKFGSCDCKELLVLFKKNDLVKNPARPCDVFVEYAAELAEKE